MLERFFFVSLGLFSFKGDVLVAQNRKASRFESVTRSKTKAFYFSCLAERNGRGNQIGYLGEEALISKDITRFFSVLGLSSKSAKKSKVQG